MRPALLRSLLLTASLLAATAHAEAPPSEVKPAEPPHEEFHEAVPVPAPGHVHEARPLVDEPGWQLGAGLSVSSAGAIGLGGLGTVTLTAPTAMLAVERRVGASTWLGLGATVTYGHQTGDGNSFLGGTDSGSGSKTTVDTSATGANVALRQILNPHEVVELSVIGNAFVGYAYSANTIDFGSGGFGTANSQTNKLKVLSVGLGVGVAAEKLLTERLALRLTLGVLGLNYTRNTTDSSSSLDPSSVTSATSSGFSAGLEPSASLTLRFLF